MQTVDYMWFRYDSTTGLANMKTVNSCKPELTPRVKGKGKAAGVIALTSISWQLHSQRSLHQPAAPKTRILSSGPASVLLPFRHIPNHIISARLTLCAHSGTGQKNEVQHPVWGLWHGMQHGVDNRKGRTLQSALSTSPCPVCHLPGLQISLQRMIYLWFALFVCLGWGFSI